MATYLAYSYFALVILLHLTILLAKTMFIIIGTTKALFSALSSAKYWDSLPSITFFLKSEYYIGFTFYILLGSKNINIPSLVLS